MIIQEECVIPIVTLDFKLKSSLCDYSDTYKLVKGRITITETRNDVVVRQADERNKGVIF